MHTTGILAVCLMLLLTACGKVPTTARQGGDNAAPGQTESAVTTIKLLAFSDPAIDALISAFYEKYPNYRIEELPFQPGPGVNFNDVVKQKFSQGGADVAMAFNTDQLVKENLLAPLEPFIQKSQFDLKGYGPGIDQIRLDGKLFTLPYSIDPQVVLYNQDLFQAAGVPLPKAGWTWDDFRATAAKLTKGDGDTKVWGFTTSAPDSLVGTYVTQKTGQPKLIVDEADLRDAFKLFTTMIFTDKSMPKAEQRDYTSGGVVDMGTAGHAFNRGRSAMTLDTLALMRYSRGLFRFKWDMVPMPVVPGGKNLTFVQAYALGIAANSKNQAAAWEFVRFVAGPEGAPLWAKQGVLPMYQTPDVKQAWFEQKPSPPHGTEALFTTSFAILPKIPAVNPERLTALSFARMKAVNAALSGDKPWEDALKDYLAAQEELRKAMQ